MSLELESDLSAYKPAPEKTSLNCFRQKAKKQCSLRLQKGQDIATQSTSYESLRALKVRSYLAEEEREEIQATQPCLIKRLWGMFQEAIGNR